MLDFKFLRRSVDRIHLMRLQSENTVFKFFWRWVDGRYICKLRPKEAVENLTLVSFKYFFLFLKFHFLSNVTNLSTECATNQILFGLFFYTEGQVDQPTTYTALLNDLERSNPKLLGEFLAYKTDD